MDGCWNTLANAADSSDQKANMKEYATHGDSTLAGQMDMEYSKDGGGDGGEGDDEGRRGDKRKDRSEISNVVNQIFQGSKPSEICIEGMPIGAIRNLVSRQLSIGSQILLQLLLMSDDKSECFNSGYTQIMELSNCRESAIKKTKLMYITLQNVSQYQNALKRDQQGALSSSSGHGVAPPKPPKIPLRVKGLAYKTHKKQEAKEAAEKRKDDPVRDRRLTRSGLTQSSPPQGVPRREKAYSVLDIPCLGRMDALFEDIDESRKLAATKLKEKVDAFVQDRAIGDSSSLLSRLKKDRTVTPG